MPENEKFSAIAGAKAVVIPSRQMGVSMTLLESMAMSVPVLVNGGSPVLLGHCKKSNGGLFYQNYFEFEGAVRYLMQHPVEYMQLCSNARAYITANYDWERSCSAFHRSSSGSVRRKLTAALEEGFAAGMPGEVCLLRRKLKKG